MSQHYWKNRDIIARDALLDKTIDEIREELRRVYLNSYKKIAKEIELLYLEIMEKGQGEVLVSHLYQYDRYYELLNNINEELRKLGLKQNDIMEKELTKMYTQISGTVQKQLGFSTEINTEEIKSALGLAWVEDGKVWSDRIWNDKDALARNLRDGLANCVATGKSSSFLAKDIADIFNTSFSNAKRLAVTELAHVEIKSTVDTYKKYGVEKYKVITARDGNVCEEDKALDGKEFPIDDTEHIPPFHPNCRCSICAVI